MWKAIWWSIGGLLLGVVLGASIGVWPGAVAGTLIGAVGGVLHWGMDHRHGGAAVCEPKQSAAPKVVAAGCVVAAVLVLGSSPLVAGLVSSVVLLSQVTVGAVLLAAAGVAWKVHRSRLGFRITVDRSAIARWDGWRGPRHAALQVRAAQTRYLPQPDRTPRAIERLRLAITDGRERAADASAPPRTIQEVAGPGARRGAWHGLFEWK